MDQKTEKAGNGLATDNFATISGIQGKQFGRDFYSSVLSFKDLRSFLAVFPEVQRDLNHKKVKLIKNYILSGLSDTIRTGSLAEFNMRFFPAITVSTRGFVFYDESKKLIAIDIKQSKLSINDGQHRFFAIMEAIGDMNARFNRTKDEGDLEKAMLLVEELNNMSLPLTIFNNVSETEEKQMFHDFNTLSLRPSRSSTIRLAQTDLISRLSMDLAKENEFLRTYGVEMEKMSIHGNNPKLILLTTIHHMVSQFEEYENESIVEENYINHKERINQWFNFIFESLPTDLNVKGKYILDKGMPFRVIGKFILTSAYIKKLDYDKIRETIKAINWKNDLDYWESYGVSQGKNGVILFSGDGTNSVYKCLMDKLSELNH